MKKAFSYALMFAVGCYAISYGISLLKADLPWILLISLAILAGVVWWRLRRSRDNNKY